MNESESYDKFFDCIDIVDGCWIWIHHRADHGTTRNTYLFDRTDQPRRFAWEMYCGELNPNKHVLPLCDQLFCVNPFHLIHARRGIELWRATGSCPNGHAVTDDSVTWSSGNAVCKRCRLEGLWRYKYRRAGVPEDQIEERIARRGEKHWTT